LAIISDTCSACERLIPYGGGAAFEGGETLHIACYLSGGVETMPSAEAVNRADQQLLGVHVLLVEDDASTTELLTAALEYSGAFVTNAGDVEAGKALLRQFRPHVIVSDISMPHDGFEVVRDVIAFAAASGLRVPAVAILATRDGRQRLRDAGFSAFICQPFDPFLLTAVVEKLAQGRAAVWAPSPTC
jgi:CheY-like chemotaxis protein